MAERAATRPDRFFDLSLDLLCTVDFPGIFRSVNPAWTRLLGHPADELVGRPLLDLVHPDDRAHAHATVTRHVRGGRDVAHGLETRLLSRGGETVWVLWSAAIDHEERLLYGIAKDVTARVAQEREVRSSRRLLEDAERVASVGSYVWEPATGRVSWSAELRRVFGVGDDMPASPELLADRLHPQDRRRVEQEIRGALAQRRGFEIRARVSGERDRPRHVLMRGEIQAAGDDGVRRVLGTVQDVTDQVRAEEDRARHASRLRRMADVALAINATRNVEHALQATADAAREIVGVHLAGISLTDEGGWERARHAVSLSERYEEWGDYAERPDGSGIYGIVGERNEPMRLTQAELERHPAWRGFGAEAERHPPMRGWLAAPLTSRTGANLGVLQLSDKTDGGDFSADDEALLVQLAQTASVAVERTTLEERYTHAQKIEAVGRLAGGIAHDFNNVLLAIHGSAELALARLDAGRPARDDVLEIQAAAERAAALTQRLLAFGRRQPQRPRVLDLNDVVRGVEGMLRRLIGHEITLDGRLEEGLPAVEADPGQLEQVIANLVVNARDAMPHGGRLTIRTHAVDLEGPDVATPTALAAGRYVALAITDTGVGMSRETRERAFEPFFTTKPEGQGSGLGLSTVHGIVRQSEGDVIVDSEPGRGTTVRLLLPTVGASPPAYRAETASAPVRGRETVALVDDDDAVRSVLESMLEGLGYTVVAAASGSELEERLLREAVVPDVLVTDMAMPGMGGEALARRLEQRWPGLPVLIVSGYSPDPRTGARLAHYEFLQKPFSLTALAARLREALGAREPRE